MVIVMVRIASSFRSGIGLATSTGLSVSDRHKSLQTASVRGGPTWSEAARPAALSPDLREREAQLSQQCLLEWVELLSVASSSPDHKLAQALDLARREAGLKTADLAQALSFNPRTVRRYLNGERRPERDTVARWEQVCKTTPGALLTLYDGSPTSDAASTSTATRARLGRRIAVAAVAVFATLLTVVLLSRANDQPDRDAPAQQHPRGVAYHTFTKNYVGDVWIRIAPAPQHIGQVHHVALHWGPNDQQLNLEHLDRPAVLFTGKRGTDSTPMQVSVVPAATITFGEDNVPAGARDINDWKHK
jgi:transcriptional regulator with XRE-family HTH domain